MKEASSLTQLYIRACKSRDPQKRLRSIYRRFYFSVPDLQDAVVAHALTEIVEEYELIRISKLIKVLDPANDWSYSGDDPSSHWNRIMTAMWSAIRYTSREELPDIGK